MDDRIGAEERAAYKTCRRRWDLGAARRGNLEPVQPRLDLPDALRQALAVYYYPGMWDWAGTIVLPLVARALEDALAARAATAEDVATGTAALAAYAAAAPELDDFAPVAINHEVDAIVCHPADPQRGLVTGDGRRVQYTAWIDLLAVDAADEYWVVGHRIAPGWAPDDELLLDDELVAACWAWERSYIGVRVAGTVYNELRTAGLSPARAGAPPPPAAWPARTGLPQHEPSGGGRSIPQHRRETGRADRAPSADLRTRRSAGPLRRTHVRRTRAEIDTVALRLGAEAAEMTDPHLAVYPSPSPGHCADCPFVEPCLEMTRGGDPAIVLAARYRPRPAGASTRPRPGGRTWGLGRGAAPPP